MLGGIVSKSPFGDAARSKFIKDLDSDAWPNHVPLVSLYSPTTWYAQRRSARLNPKAWEISMQNEVVRGIGHTALTHDPGVYMLIRKHLEATR